MHSRPANPPSNSRGHIGRIVAGSLIGGLVVAIALVVGPFAGSKEHVITGSVLLAFAASWAALAVLSARFTHQPPRGGIVPAGFIAGGRGRDAFFGAPRPRTRRGGAPLV